MFPLFQSIPKPLSAVQFTTASSIAIKRNSEEKFFWIAESVLSSPFTCQL